MELNWYIMARNKIMFFLLKQELENCKLIVGVAVLNDP